MNDLEGLLFTINAKMCFLLSVSLPDILGLGIRINQNGSSSSSLGGTGKCFLQAKLNKDNQAYLGRYQSNALSPRSPLTHWLFSTPLLPF